MSTTTKLFSFIMITTFIMVLLGSSSATVYKDGSSFKWTPEEENYNDWADAEELNVGDSLVFKYDHNFNNVTQVSTFMKYKFCDSSSPKAVYNTGNDVVNLTKSGQYYFISSNRSQCLEGQKLQVLVVHDQSRLVIPTRPIKILCIGTIYKFSDSKGWSVPKAIDYDYKWCEEKRLHEGDGLTSPLAVNRTGDGYCGLKLGRTVDSLVSLFRLGIFLL